MRRAAITEVSLFTGARAPGGRYFGGPPSAGVASAVLGWTMRSVPVGDVVSRLLPWTVAGFIVMVITGSLLFYAIPLRTYQSIFFRTKMVLLLLAGLNIWLFHTRIYPQVAV